MKLLQLIEEPITIVERPLDYQTTLKIEKQLNLSKRKREFILSDYGIVIIK